MKLVFILAVTSSALSSCFSSKDITKKEPITPDFLSKLEPRKTYVFELTTGQIQAIYINGVEGETITGYLYPNVYTKKSKIAYSDSFENIAKNVAKISVRKIDPAKTTVAILVPVTVIASFAILVSQSGFSNMTF